MIKVMHSCLFPPRKVLVTLSPHPTGGIGPLYCTKHTLGRPRFVSQLRAGSTGIVIVIVIAVVKQGILVNIRARGPPRRRRRVCVVVVHVQQHGVLPPVLVRAHVRAGGAARLVIVERAILASSSFALGGRVGGGRGRGEGGRGRGRP
jgi:hypothetical protein